MKRVFDREIYSISISGHNMLCASFEVIKIIDFWKHDVLGVLSWNDDYFCDTPNCAHLIGYNDWFIAGSGTGSILYGEHTLTKLKVINTISASQKGIFSIIPSSFYDQSFLSIDKSGIASFWSI